MLPPMFFLFLEKNFLKLLCEFPTDCEEIRIQFYLVKEVAVTTEEEELGSALSSLCFAIAQVSQRLQIYAIEIRYHPQRHTTTTPNTQQRIRRRRRELGQEWKP
jgi:hypothetical protein